MSTRSKALNRQRNPRPLPKNKRVKKRTPEQQAQYEHERERREARNRVAEAMNPHPTASDAIEARLKKQQSRKRANYWRKPPYVGTAGLAA